jgi:hypothetical protein
MAYTVTNLIKMTFHYGFFSLVFILVLFFQNIIGFSIIKTGYYFIFLGIMYFITAFFSGNIIRRIGPRLPSFLGLVFFALAFFLFFQLKVDFSMIQLIVALVFCGFALALLFPATRILSYISLVPEQSITTSSIFFTNALIGGSIGIAMSSSILYFESSKYLLKQLELENIQLGSFQVLQKAAHGVLPIDKLKNYISEDISRELTMTIKEAFMKGFSKAMLVCMILCVVSLAFTYFMRKEKI